MKPSISIWMQRCIPAQGHLTRWASVCVADGFAQE